MHNFLRCPFRISTYRLSLLYQVTRYISIHSFIKMRASIFAPIAFALAVYAAPAADAAVSDCESLKSLAVLNGAKLFCAEHFPASTTAVVEGTPKSNAKRFKEDDDRVMRVLGRMPESRQKAFCACYPAAPVVSVSL
jgi:hypothetical protein